MPISELVSELQIQRSRCLLDSAAWKPCDHFQLNASLPNAPSLSVPFPGAHVSTPLVGFLLSEEKPTSWALPQNLSRMTLTAPVHLHVLLALLLTLP